MNKNVMKVIAAVIVIVAVVIGLIRYGKYELEKVEQDIQVNRQTLKSLEQRDINDIENLLKKIRTEYGINRIDVESISNTRYFEDSIFMGDSLMEPLYLYEFLMPNNVLAKMGRNTTTALEDVPELKKSSPQRIFMLYGMNDLTTKANSDEFKKAYLKLIGEVKKVQPNSEIILLSIMPVTENAVRKQPVLKDDNVAEFNKRIKEIAEENSFRYIDITTLIKDQEIYEPDGIHMKPKFYPEFLSLIKNEFLNKE